MTLAEVAPVRLRVPGRSLVLVAGMPGAGKSTLLRTLPADPRVVVLDSEQAGTVLRPAAARDALPWLPGAVHLLHRSEVVRAALAGPETVVVHLPATADRVRAAVLALARRSGREAHLLWLHAEPAEALAGQRVRGRVVRGPRSPGTPPGPVTVARSAAGRPAAGLGIGPCGRPWRRAPGTGTDK